MENKQFAHLPQLLLATLFISTSGVLGKYIHLPVPVIIWWRAILAFVFLLIFAKSKKISLFLIDKKDIKTFLLSAIFMTLHWITYFFSLKKSNVAIGMLSLYTFPVITALIEPFFTKKRINPIQLFLGVLVMIGMYILAPKFDIKNSVIQGILFGIFSAFCYALRNLIIKKHTANYHGTTLMIYQLGFVALFLTPILFFYGTKGITTEFPYVILLALLTTAIGHTLLVMAFRYFAVSTASIISSVQPIFGIVLAYLFLNEIPSWNTFFGGLLILTSVVIESVRQK